MFKKSEDYKGRILEGEALLHFHTLGVGQKLGYIRKILEEEYGEEYSRREVSKECNITHQGLIFLEEHSKRKPRDITLSKLMQKYNIASRTLEDRSSIGGSRIKFDPIPFFIGKPEDRTLYLQDESSQNIDQYSWIINFNPSSNTLLDVDLDLSVYIPNTPVIHKKASLAHKVKLTIEDIQFLEEIVNKHVELVVSRREALCKLRDAFPEEENKCP